MKFSKCVSRLRSPSSDSHFVYLMCRPADPAQDLAMNAHLKGEDILQQIEDKLATTFPPAEDTVRKLFAKIRQCFDFGMGEFAMLGLNPKFAHMGVMVDGKYYHLKREKDGHLALDTQPFPENSIVCGRPIWKTKLPHKAIGKLALYALAVMRMKWDLESIPVYDGDKILPHHDFLRDGTSYNPSIGRLRFNDIFHNCQNYASILIALIMLPTVKGLFQWIGTAAEMIALHESGDYKDGVLRSPLMQLYLDGDIPKDAFRKRVLDGEMRVNGPLVQQYLDGDISWDEFRDRVLRCEMS